MTLRERYQPIAVASNYLVIASFVTLVAILFIAHGFSLPNLAIGCTIILVGNFCFVASGLLAPNLMMQGKIVFPLNVTLPLIYSAWMGVIAYLAMRLGSPLEPTMEPLRVFGQKFSSGSLWFFPLGQIAAMTVGIALGSKKVETSE